ncbi:MAG: gamma-glutamyltransferase [Gibbsiella quercinecans]|uniref:gamma-glutamyltransferase n=1 Tax=Gibbsiella quercinecans TaxID=929813 RepID=UPI003F3A4175
MPLFDTWFKTFLLEGRAPRAGEVFRNPDLAKTLRELAAREVESFYRGELAQRLVAFSRVAGAICALTICRPISPVGLRLCG